MESKPELRQMASEGKDKLEWSRTVDAEKLEKLKEMMASPDYKVSRELQQINWKQIFFRKIFPS